MENGESSCGLDLAVAFACKVRGLCPSCCGRRMSGSAAHLVDRILPSVPTRQYVLAFPYELSGLAATRAFVLTRLSRIFWEALRLHYRRWAKAAGLGALAAHAETGAVTGVHRAGASLNVHVHFHLLCLDGVYVEEDGALRFVPAPAPTQAELLAILERIVTRVKKWLARKGLVRDADESNAPPELSPAEALTAAALARGTLHTVREDDGTPTRDDVDDDAQRAAYAAQEKQAVTFERFNLHAAVSLRADDDMGRERLCRYLTRPAFALSRLRKERDGTLTYRVKKTRHGRVKVRRMTPVECLARLAAIVPPPRYPLLRMHGVLAPRHALRPRVVPRPPVAHRTHACNACNAHACDAHDHAEPKPKPATDKRVHDTPASGSGDGDGRAVLRITEPVPTAELTASGHAERVGPNVLSFAHWQRLLEGELYASSSRVDWATLLRRTFDVDIRRCARCDGAVRVRAVVTDADAIHKLLAVLRRPRDPPRAA